MVGRLADLCRQEKTGHIDTDIVLADKMTVGTVMINMGVIRG